MAESIKITAKSPEVNRENATSQTRKPKLSQSINSPVGRILYLQATVGNRAVQRIMSSGVLQAKLRIGQPNDIYEQEADRVADQVMHMPEPRVQRQPEEEEEEEIQPKLLADQITPLVQRQTEEEEEEPIQTKLVGGVHVQRQAEELEEEENVQRHIQKKEKSAHTETKSDPGRAVEAGIDSHLQATKGEGRPLPENTKAKMESSFGVDFSNVRIHTGPLAVQMSESLNAQAFTHRTDIYFNRGKYNPEESSGKHLLAHELTHVIHQKGKNQNLIRRQAGERKANPGMSQGTRSDVRGFIEDTIRFWSASREYLRYRTVDRSLLVRMLNSWLRMVNNGWRLIDTRLGGEPALLNRLKTTYRDAVRTLITKASRDLGVTQQQLYRQQNTRIAWWARRDLAAREDIVFIMGSGDRFYRSATRYFNFIGARVIANLRSLLEVRDWLNANRPANRLPWGDVSIVVHANLEGQMQIPVAPDESRVTVDSLRQAIQDRSFRALPNEVVDNATRIIIRGCALGRNQEILQLLRSAFGGNEESPHIYAPVHLQTYAYRWRRRRRRRRRETISAEEFFMEFWYVGFPSRPRLNRRTLARMFAAKYPNVAVNWNRMLRRRRATRRQTYTITYTVEQTNKTPLSSQRGSRRTRRRRRRRLARMIRRRFDNAGSWRNIRETSRSIQADGTIRITFSYRSNNQEFTGASIPGLLPRLRNQRAYRAFLSRQADLMATTRPLEEGSNLTANDFFWRLRRLRNRGAHTYDYRFTGSRTMLRIQRELVEPDPNRPGRTRRVRPDLSEPRHYGREVPSNY